MKKYNIVEHFSELKNRALITLLYFSFSFGISYLFKEKIYEFFALPLIKLSTNSDRKMIYTSLTEAFFSHIKLSVFSALCLTLPVFCMQTYLFLSSGLYKLERRIAFYALSICPILFYSGIAFAFYFIIPKAWEFFLSYEDNRKTLPLIMHAKISEYLDLSLQIIFAFGIAFQMPIFILILKSLDLVNSKFLKKKRKIALIIIFIFAAILTPPDIISQIGLALPLCLLYEISILMCRLLENRG